MVKDEDEEYYIIFEFFWFTRSSGVLKRITTLVHEIKKGRLSHVGKLT